MVAARQYNKYKNEYAITIFLQINLISNIIHTIYNTCMWFDLGFADILIVEFSELKSYRPIFSDNKEPRYCMF
jgi:hypothetical protein